MPCILVLGHDNALLYRGVVAPSSGWRWRYATHDAFELMEGCHQLGLRRGYGIELGGDETVGLGNTGSQIGYLGAQRSIFGRELGDRVFEVALFGNFACAVVSLSCEGARGR